MPGPLLMEKERTPGGGARKKLFQKMSGSWDGMSLIVPNCNLMSHPEVCYDTIARYGRGPERNAGAFAYGNFPCRVQASFIRRGPERNAGAFPYGKNEKTGKGGEETEKPCEVPMPGSVTIWQHPAQEIWAENRRKEECSA